MSKLINYNRNNLSLPGVNGRAGCLEKDVRKHDGVIKTFYSTGKVVIRVCTFIKFFRV